MDISKQMKTFDPCLAPVMCELKLNWLRADVNSSESARAHPPHPSAEIEENS